ncbi:MAG: rlmCD [Acidobacteria bacterium]|nr:rlmCD [Acidobacteriota bacterium]
MLQTGTVVELVIDKPVAGGRMLARHGGMVVLVSAAIPGERVRALVERTSAGVAYAVTVEVVEASPDRRAAAGDWACGGNVYAHVAYPRQLALKSAIVLDALARIGRVTHDRPLAVTPSPERGYRMRARFHVRGPRVGFFREGTHHLCDPAVTGQLLPESEGLVAGIGEILAAGRLHGVTAIELAENIPGTERALHLELDRPAAPVGLEELAGLPSVVGVGASFTSAAPREAPRGRPGPSRPGRERPQGWRRTVTAGGPPCVLDELALDGATPFRLQHNASAFFQGNRYLLAPLAVRVRSLVPRGPVVDLYAGAGLFAATLAASGWESVAAVESDRSAAADLRANAAPFGPSLVPVEMPVEDYLASRRPEGMTVVIDPPRTGMSREASAALASSGAARIVYVSCDVATFARDARRLLDADYALEHLEAFDLFPNTAHVEAVAVFTRQPGR